MLEWVCIMPRPPLPIPLRYTRSRDLARREESRAWRALFWAIGCVLGSATAMIAPWPGDGFFHATGMGANSSPCSVFFENGEDIDERELSPSKPPSPPMPPMAELPEQEVLPDPPDTPLQAQVLHDFLQDKLPRESENLLMADIATAIDDPFSAAPGPPPRRAAPKPNRSASPAFSSAAPAIRRASGNGRTQQIAVGENASNEDRVRVSYLSAPKPPYPVALRMARAEGSVGVRIAVSAEGKPTHVSVVRSSGYSEMDSTAVRWILEHWRFHPEKRGGHAVASTVTTSIHFKID